MPIATPSPMPSERLGDSALKLSIPHLGIIFARRCNCNNDDNDEENTHTRQSTEYKTGKRRLTEVEGALSLGNCVVDTSAADQTTFLYGRTNSMV
jgi:hypothetical protein